MSEMLAFYQEQAKKNQSTIPWLARLQAKALDEFNNQGFPTRHHEEWKYTLVDSLLKQSFALPAVTQSTDAPSDIPVRHQIKIHNGQIASFDTITQQLPSGVIIMSLAQALVAHADLVQQHLAQILEQEHAFQHLNTAMIECGIFIYIPKKVCIEEPIALVHYQDENNQAVYLRHLIIAEAESMATIVEEYSGAEQCTYLSNTVTELCLGKLAQLNHYKIQRESKEAYHLGHIAVKQAAYSDYSHHSMSLGGKLVRSDLAIYLHEEFAQCLMNGIYAPAEGQHVDHHTTVNHLVPNCKSAQDYKGILKGRSRAVFNGKVKVAKDAQHSDAQQQNKNILLSAQAEIDTKPQLEIFAHDVVCTHGATVGQLDEDALFYLATRGIDRAEASHYLIHAFAHDNLRLIPNPELAEWMSHLLTQQVG